MVKSQEGNQARLACTNKQAAADSGPSVIVCFTGMLKRRVTFTSELQKFAMQTQEKTTT